jgi:hypothetical protein
VATAPTANEIKSQLKTLLDPVIGTALTKKAKIFDYMAMAFKPGELEDPTVLRSALDPIAQHPSGRVNCLMLTERGFTQPPQPRETGRTNQAPRPSRVVVRQIGFTYFYQYGGNATELTFSTNVELIRSTVSNSPHLGFAMVDGAGRAGQGAFIEGHDELQMPLMIPDAFGDVICHVADGTLTVWVTKTATR